MLTRGIGDLRESSSKMRCGVFEVSTPKSAPARASALDLDRKPVGKLGETILLEESLQPGEVEAVDQDLRIAAVAGSLAIGRDDQAIVIHGRGWSDPSDQANGLHSAGIFPCLKMSHQIFWSASE